MKKFSVANQKGGVGKTTVVRHLAHSAIERGLRTLVIDLDPQGNLTRSVRATLPDPSMPADRSGAHLLFQTKVAPIPQKINENLSLFAGNRDLTAVLEWPIDCVEHARAHLASLDDQFDICLIDTPPTMCNLLFAGMICADYLAMPCDLDEDATTGLLDLADQAERIREHFNPALQLVGVLLNKVNSRRAYDQAERIALRNQWGDVILDAELQERSATKLAKKAPVWRNPRGDSDRRAAREMRAVCEAIFTKIGF
ncbi:MULTISPECIES: ParA family protein [Paraburkholderia]|uniref:ParA family protein n=1 Tax=Paraburkholderia madseniana TaxID=2599607 RepID=A0AAP5EYC6_9BURK|nr:MULTISPECIES: ParA family protein [Paraburkholderia]MCX4150027.1 ParA family protein [Paraburkholderia madseniana]MCX4175682.1 ParA family protein [Paraburkholderia madseniana]MDN7152963.1 ParA family protein [Paraburkholderia sp. WS6]MDQ6411845.1 ParA family protein [Paraburkholderia madseniana]MDQ6463677.1 ParA family protein [Paraburkholderia madseniana]